MTLPTTEVTIFATSDAFRANPRLLAPAIQQLKAAGVDVPVYAGLEVEDPQVGFIVVNWDSYEHHQHVAQAPYYAELTRGLGPALAGPPNVYHVQFSAPAVALDAPVTEVVLLSVNNPEKRAAVVDVLSRMSAASDKLLVFGQTREDESKYVVLCGWPSVEAHRETVAKPNVAAALETVLSLANKDHGYHAKLTRY